MTRFLQTILSGFAWKLGAVMLFGLVSWLTAGLFQSLGMP